MLSEKRVGGGHETPRVAEDPVCIGISEQRLLWVEVRVQIPQMLLSPAVALDAQAEPGDEVTSDGRAAVVSHETERTDADSVEEGVQLRRYSFLAAVAGALVGQTTAGRLARFSGLLRSALAP